MCQSVQSMLGPTKVWDLIQLHSMKRMNHLVLVLVNQFIWFSMEIHIHEGNIVKSSWKLIFMKRSKLRRMRMDHFVTGTSTYSINADILTELFQFLKVFSNSEVNKESISSIWDQHLENRKTRGVICA